MKKNLSLLMAFVLFLAVSLSGVQGVSANSFEAKKDDVTEKDIQEGKMLEEHLHFDTDNNKFILFDKKGLETSLDDISSTTNVDVLEKDINKINSVIVENEGENQLNASACSIALTLMGLYQGMTVAAAAAVLVVSAPLVLSATFAVGAVWAGGQLACP